MTETGTAMVPQMCTSGDLTGEECLRVAQWEWRPEGEHPVFLCNFHAGPLRDAIGCAPGGEVGPVLVGMADEGNRGER